MKDSILFKFTFSLFCLFVLQYSAKATTYLAVNNGSYSSAAVWSGGVVPSYYMTTGDTVVINSGTTVTLDQDISFNNASALLLVSGTLSGTNSIDLQNGGLTGFGSITIHNITTGASASCAFSGILTADNFYNSQTLLNLIGVTYINDTISFNAGVVQLSNTGSLTLADSMTLVLAGGTYGISGNVFIHGAINLLYTGSANLITGPELSLTFLNNITVNMSRDSAQVNLAADMTGGGKLTLSRGRLHLNTHTLTINNTISTSANAGLMSTGGSTLNVGGAGNAGNFSFVEGADSLEQVNINLSFGAFIHLGSDLVVNNSLAVDSGTLEAIGVQVTSHGQITGSGYLATGNQTTLNLIGSGNMGTLRLAGGSYGDTLGYLNLSAVSSGAVTLGSNAHISRVLSVSAGNVILKGFDLSLGGTTVMTGTGAIIGDSLANISVASGGSVGTLLFASGSTFIHDFTVSGGNVILGTGLSLIGRLKLMGGIISTGPYDLILTQSDSILGGSSTSYVATLGSGSLILPVSSSLLSPDSSRMLFIGTSADYAPIRITNNSNATGNFKGNAHPGVYDNGTSGNDLSLTKPSVNTSWLIESDITASPNVTIQAFWSHTMQVNNFDSSRAYLSHYTNSAWDSLGTSQTMVDANGMISLTRRGITSFSPFAVFSSATPGVLIGTQDIAAESSFSAYPNPAHNITTISVSDPKNYNRIRVYDMIGNEVAQYPVTQTMNNIDISRLTAGVYFVSVGDKYTQKLIKQ